MEVHQLTYFASVARTGNFSRAAALCNVSQPSLSQQIRKLEEELGEPLLLRARRGAQLTPLGELFLPRAQLILREIAAAQEDAAAFATLAQGSVRVAAIPTVAPYLLPQIVAAVSERFPGLQLILRELATEVLLQQLQNGELDFGLASPPFESVTQMTYRELLQDELLVAMPARHPLRARDQIDLDELARHPLVLMNETHCLSQQTRSLCRARGLAPSVSIESAQLDTAVALVASGQGLSLVPAMARTAMQRHPVHLAPLGPEPAFRSVGLVWPAARILTRAQRGFLDACRGASAGAASTGGA